MSVLGAPNMPGWLAGWLQGTYSSSNNGLAVRYHYYRRYQCWEFFCVC